MLLGCRWLLAALLGSATGCSADAPPQPGAAPVGTPTSAPDRLVEKGHALRESGKLEEAARVYRDVLRLDPSHRGARLNLGSTLKRLGRSDDAIRVYRKGLVRHPDDLHLLENLAGVYIDLGRHHDATPLVRRALTIRQNGELHDGENRPWVARWTTYLESQE